MVWEAKTTGEDNNVLMYCPNFESGVRLPSTLSKIRFQGGSQEHVHSVYNVQVNTPLISLLLTTYRSVIYYALVIV